MSKCTRTNCKGELILLRGSYGQYWKCSICGHTINRKCGCGTDRVITTYNGATVTRCARCGKYRY